VRREGAGGGVNSDAARCCVGVPGEGAGEEGEEREETIVHRAGSVRVDAGEHDEGDRQEVSDGYAECARSVWVLSRCKLDVGGEEDRPLLSAVPVVRPASGMRGVWMLLVCKSDVDGGEEAHSANQKACTASCTTWVTRCVRGTVRPGICM
jgi:hypothetical protein